MKVSFEHDDELRDFEAMDDARLAGVVRDAVKRYRARDNAGNVGEAKEIERSDHTADDPPPTRGSAGNPARPGATVAAHDSLASIPGYSRIGPNRDGRSKTIDEDLIVQSPKRAW